MRANHQYGQWNARFGHWRSTRAVHARVGGAGPQQRREIGLACERQREQCRGHRPGDLVTWSPFAPAVHQLPQDARAQRHLAPVLLMPQPRQTPRRRRRSSLSRTQHPRRGPRRVRRRSRPRRCYRAVSTTGRRRSRRAHPAHPGRRATRRRTRTIRPQDRQRDRRTASPCYVGEDPPARQESQALEFRLIRTPGSGETHCLAARTSPTGCPLHASR